MSILDWTFNPLTEVERMRREVDNLFGRFGWTPGQEGGFPGVNLYDAGDDILVAVEAPGMTKDRLKVELREDALVLSGTREAPEGKDGPALREERPSGTFAKTIRLPIKVAAEKVEAQFKDGILRIRLPKSVESRPRQIAITA